MPSRLPYGRDDLMRILRPTHPLDAHSLEVAKCHVSYVMLAKHLVLNLSIRRTKCETAWTLSDFTVFQSEMRSGHRITKGAFWHH